MTTPKTEDVIAKAFELHHKRNCSISAINPEVEELKESGIYAEARNELMRNSEASEYRSYIESEAISLGLIDEDIQLAKQTKPYLFQIDIQEALRSGVFVSGGKGQCKSNLGITIADKMLKLGYTVKALDISQAWLKSSIPYVYEVESVFVPKLSTYQSVVYDLSKLTPKEIKNFIAKFLAKEWNQQIAIPEHKRKWIIYVFEECQILTPQGSLRSNEAQQTLRLMSSGRNYNLGFIAITQRPALTDTSVFELTFQKYFARMNGENDVRKVSQYIGSLAYDLEKLKLGEFMYDKGSVTKWITTKEFKPQTKPRKLSMPNLSIPQTTQPKPKPTNTKALSSIALLLIWLLILWIALK